MIFSLLSKKTKEDYILLFDISSGSVRSGILKVSANKKSELLATVKANIVTSSNFVHSDFVNALGNSINEVLDKISKNISELNSIYKNNIKINKISCFYSSPWCISQNKIIKIEKSNDVVVTEKMIKEIFKTEELSFFANETIKSDVNLDNKSLTLIEKRATSIKLNGYETPNPYSQKAKKIEVDIFMSATSKDIITQIENIIKTYFPLHNIQHHSFNIAAFSLLRNIYSQKHNFIIVNVREDVSDFMLISNGALAESCSMPIGSRDIIKLISDTYKIESILSESKLNMFYGKVLEKTESDRFNKVIKNAQKTWSEKFDEIMRGQAVHYSIPKDVFLICDNLLQFFYSEAITSSDFNKFTFSGGENFSVNFIEHSDLRKFCDNKDFITENAFVEIVGIYTDKIIY